MKKKKKIEKINVGWLKENLKKNEKSRANLMSQNSIGHFTHRYSFPTETFSSIFLQLSAKVYFLWNEEV